jgi:hypothetical protein
MFKISSLALAALLVVSVQGAAAATQTSAKPLTTQQTRMKTCNAGAAGKTGDDRKSYMSSCLSKKKTSATASSSQVRMKSCNAEAKGKTGADRKTFMSSCLKAT